MLSRCASRAPKYLLRLANRPRQAYLGLRTVPISTKRHIDYKMQQRTLFDWFWKNQNTSDVDDLVQTAKTFRQEGRLAEAYDSAERALAIAYSRWGERPDAHPNMMWIWLELGAVQSATAKFKESSESFQYAMSLAEQELGQTHPQVAYIMESQGINFMRQGDLQSAFTTFKAALELLLSHTPPVAADDADETSTPPTANKKLDEAMENTRELQREEIDSVFHNLIASLYQMGRFNECDSYYRDYFTRFGDTFLEDIETARFQNNWGLVLQQIGRTKDAEGLFLESLRIRELILGPEHPAVIGSLSNLGQFYLEKQKDVTKAEDFLQRAINLANKCLPPGHPSLLHEMLNYCKFLGGQGKHTQAIAEMQSALGKCKPTGENFMVFVQCFKQLGEQQLKAGQLVDAEKTFNEMLEQLLAIPDVGKTPLANMLVDVLSSLVTVYSHNGDIARVSELTKVLEQMKSSQKKR